MSSELTTSPTTILPVDVFTLPSSEFANLPLETLIGLPIEKMSEEQKQEYVKTLRAARTNAPTLVKHVKASLTEPAAAKKSELSATAKANLLNSYLT